MRSSRGLNAAVLALSAMALAGAGCNNAPETAQGNTAGDNGATATKPTANGTMLTIKGSDTLLQLAQAWAENFKSKHPEVNISVTGGGSSTGFTSLANGQCDVADASRSIEPKETEEMKAKGINPVEHTVARDALSVIVNKSNPVKEMTLDQLANLYLGKVQNWKDVGGPDQKVTLTARDTSSGTYAYFKEHVLKKKDYAPQTLHLPSNVAIAKQVGSDVGSVGYVGMGYVSPDVKAISIKKDAASPAVAPTLANVLNNTYSLSRPLFEYTNGEPTGSVKAWIDFVTGPDGQKIVEQKEFIPVKTP